MSEWKRRVEARDMRIAAASWERAGGSKETADAMRDEADRHERGGSPTPHAHLRDEPAAAAHEDGLAVCDDEREVESGPRGDDVR